MIIIQLDLSNGASLFFNCVILSELKMIKWHPDYGNNFLTCPAVLAVADNDVVPAESSAILSGLH